MARAMSRQDPSVAEAPFGMTLRSRSVFSVLSVLYTTPITTSITFVPVSPTRTNAPAASSAR